MKKKIILLAALIFLIPFMTHAEELKYEICKEGCEYSEVQDVFALLVDLDYNHSVPENAIYDVVIEIKDDATYNVDFRQLENGYVTNTSAKTFVIRGTDKDHRPTLYSGDDQMSFWIKYGTYFLIENIIMKNLETDYSFHGGDLFIMANGENDLIEIRNSEFYAQDCFDIWAYSIKITDSAFYADDGIGFDAYEGDNIIENVIVRPTEYFDFTGRGICSAKNVDVEAEDIPKGIWMQGICQNTLDNVNVRGAEIGVYIYGPYSSSTTSQYKGFTKQTIIKNSDLSQNDVSLEAMGNHMENDRDVIVENTKIKAINSIGKIDVDETLLGPIIYVKGDAKWEGPIIRSTDPENDATVREIFDGTVMIEESHELFISATDNLFADYSLENFFSNTNEIDYKLIEWTSSDEEIAVIEEGVIHPKKTGHVELKGTYENNVYQISLDVLSNPKTGKNIMIFVGLLIFIIIGCSLIYRKKERPI